MPKRGVDRAESSVSCRREYYSTIQFFYAGHISSSIGNREQFLDEGDTMGLQQNLGFIVQDCRGFWRHGKTDIFG